MKTIILSIPFGMSARNILQSDIFRILKENHRVVVLTPLFRDENFKKEFGGGNVIFRNLPKEFSLAYKVYRRLLDIAEGYHFTKKTGIETLTILAECLRRTNPGTYYARKLFGMAVPGALIDMIRGAQGSLLKSGYYRALFDEFRPDMAILTHPLALEEFAPAFYARRSGIPLFGMIHSWDNITAKSGMRTVTSNNPGRMLPLRFDRVIVWNDIIKKELMDFYGYRAEDIFVSGIPQFDFYVRHGIRPREAFFKEIGADPEKKLILYAAGSEFLLPRQDEVIEVLIRAVNGNRFPEPVQLLVRGHPGTKMDSLMKRFGGSKNVLLDQPGAANAAVAVSKGWQKGIEEQAHLAETLYHSDVTVNVTSTMSIDAAVFDRPTVCIGFDGNVNFPYHRSIIKHYDFTHYRHIMRTGGVRVAKSADELIGLIGAYLRNPGLDSEGRRRIREEECYRLDGKAGERIGNYISDFLCRAS